MTRTIAPSRTSSTLGIGTLLLGVVVMFVWQARAPAFFAGKTLTHDTPALVVEEGAPPAG